jgi:hypothetical protein
VAPAADSDRSGRRRVLGAEKNPLKPKVTPTPTPSAAAPTGTPKSPAATTAPGLTLGGSPVAPTSPVSTIPVPAKKTYQLNELTVRFGLSDGSRPPRKDVKRLRALPSNDEPVLIYLGVLADKKTVVFMLDSGVVAQGDGDCRPSRTNCETLQIKEGETEFFDVAAEDTGDGTTPAPDAAPAAQYQLDVIKIRRKVTSSASQAKKSIARVSESGRKILRARIMGDGPIRYRYDHSTGRLEKLSRKAYKAVVAKASRSARAGF